MLRARRCTNAKDRPPLRRLARAPFPPQGQPARALELERRAARRAPERSSISTPSAATTFSSSRTTTASPTGAPSRPATAGAWCSFPATRSAPSGPAHPARERLEPRRPRPRPAAGDRRGPPHRRLRDRQPSQLAGALRPLPDRQPGAVAGLRGHGDPQRRDQPPARQPRRHGQVGHAPRPGAARVGLRQRRPAQARGRGPGVERRLLRRALAGGDRRGPRLRRLLRVDGRHDQRHPRQGRLDHCRDGERPQGRSGDRLRQAHRAQRRAALTVEVPAKARYIRFECYGCAEERAWTQPFFVEAGN